MTECNLSVRRCFARHAYLLFASLIVAVGLGAAQTNQTQLSKGPDSSTSRGDDYVIGPGDVLSITVTDAPEFSGKFRVDQSGYLTMSSLPEPMAAAGLTPLQLSRNLVAALEEARLYRDPTVNVFVEEYHSRTVSVVGAVAKPGVYPLQRRTSVVEVVSEAGLLPTAGNRVTILPVPGESKHPDAIADSQTFDLGKLMSGSDPKANVEVHEGEIIRVSNAEVVYVVGAVIKPGGFAVQDQSAGVTALQAVALAQGMTTVASTHRAVIVRRNFDGSAHRQMPVDLGKIMSGKADDVQLLANDILYIPTSGTKLTLRTMGEVAMMAANGVAFYGLGYRVGTR